MQIFLYDYLVKFAYNKYSVISGSNKKRWKRKDWGNFEILYVSTLFYGYCFKAVFQISHCFRVDDLEILSISDLFEVIGENGLSSQITRY